MNVLYEEIRKRVQSDSATGNRQWDDAILPLLVRKEVRLSSSVKFKLVMYSCYFCCFRNELIAVLLVQRWFSFLLVFIYRDNFFCKLETCLYAYLWRRYNITFQMLECHISLVRCILNQWIIGLILPLFWHLG